LRVDDCTDETAIEELSGRGPGCGDEESHPDTHETET
jgi:hypothetical protein